MNIYDVLYSGAFISRINETANGRKVEEQGGFRSGSSDICIKETG